MPVSDLPSGCRFIGRSRRVAADRISGEERRADQPRACRADQGRCCAAAGRGVTGASQPGGAGQEQRPCHREVRGLNPATRSERERADRVAQRSATVPGGSFKQERGDEDGACDHTAPQQAAGPRLPLIGRPGGLRGVKCSDQALICREPGDRPGDTSTSPPCARLPAGSATSACSAANQRPGRRRHPRPPRRGRHRQPRAGATWVRMLSMTWAL
jgi:hypothetical protein